jgi:hypothetical protein
MAIIPYVFVRAIAELARKEPLDRVADMLATHAKVLTEIAHSAPVAKPLEPEPQTAAPSAH